MNQLSKQDIELHTRIVGWLLILSSGILFVIGVIGFFFLTGLGLAIGDPDVVLILGTIGTWGGLLFTLLSLPGFLAGYGLLRRREWGRILAIVVAFLSLLNFPLGTLLGAYALWVLLQNSATEFFAQPSHASA
jgi:hypothetical protein